SKWIAYTRPESDSMNKIHLFSVEQGKDFEATDGWYDSRSPAFSGDGKYLFFVSNRDFTPTYGQTEFNHIYRDMSRIYFVTLSKDTESPFKPKDDEVGDKPAAPPDAGKKEPLVLKVDTDGLKDRILSLPIQAANYGNLSSVGSTVYYL